MNEIVNWAITETLNRDKKRKVRARSDRALMDIRYIPICVITGI